MVARWPKVPTGAAFVELSRQHRSNLRSPRDCAWLAKAMTASRSKGIAERVRQHDGFRAIGDGGFKLSYVDVVSRKLNVDEDRDESVLNDRIDRGGKAGGHGDDFVAAAQSGGRRATAEVRHESAARLADDPELTSEAQRTPMKAANSRSNWAAKRPVVSQASSEASTRCSSSAESKTLPETGHAALAGHECRRRQRDVIVLLDERADFVAQLAGIVEFLWDDVMASYPRPACAIAAGAPRNSRYQASVRSRPDVERELRAAS